MLTIINNINNHSLYLLWLLLMKVDDVVFDNNNDNFFHLT